MAAVDVFRVAADDLDEVVEDLERIEASLQHLGEDLERQMRALHDTWEGLAAQAHAEAQLQWSAGMKAMTLALTDLRAAARTAHENYTAAGRANLEVWQALR